ncbi:MAG: hypothetical protein ACE3JK_10130 [Sporolactobacillus sp.]
MKKIWLIVVVLFCLASIIGGKIYWNHRIHHISQVSMAQSSDLTAGLQVNDDTSLPIMKQINRLPVSLRTAAKKAYKTSGQVHVALLGDDEVQSMAPALQNRLDQTFGQLFFKVTPIDVGKTTSLQLNQAKLSALFQKQNGTPDAVIFIPLIYNDDHKVGTEDTETVTSLFQEKVQKKYPKAAYYISLPNYSSKLTYLNERINSLSSALRKQKTTMINYLKDWPRGIKMKTVVQSDGKTMSRAGQTLWVRAVAKEWGMRNP